MTSSRKYSISVDSAISPGVDSARRHAVYISEDEWPYNHDGFLTKTHVFVNIDQFRANLVANELRILLPRESAVDAEIREGRQITLEKLRIKGNRQLDGDSREFVLSGPVRAPLKHVELLSCRQKVYVRTDCIDHSQIGRQHHLNRGMRFGAVRGHSYGLEAQVVEMRSDLETGHLKDHAEPIGIRSRLEGAADPRRSIVRIRICETELIDQQLI